MTSLSEKKDLILEYEERFAFSLAREVIEAPKLSFWMVLIPFILVYHMFQHRRVMDGRKGFAQNYLVTRKRALNGSLSLAEKCGSRQIDEILSEGDLPEEARGPFRELLSLLMEHYADLLRAHGHDMWSLVRSAYKTRTNYLLFLNRLNQVEKDLNAALKPHFEKTVTDIDVVLERIQVSSERLRRKSAEFIFM